MNNYIITLPSWMIRLTRHTMAQRLTEKETLSLLGDKSVKLSDAEGAVMPEKQGISHSIVRFNGGQRTITIHYADQDTTEEVAQEAKAKTVSELEAATEAKAETED